MPGFVIADHVIDAFVHEQKDFFLTLRFERMDFIEKQHAPVRQRQQTRLVLLGSGVGTFLIAEQIGQKQFGIVGIFSAVDRHEIALFTDNPFFYTVFIGQLGDVAFASSGLSLQKNRQTDAGIGNRRFALFYALLQTFLMTDQLAERNDFLFPGCAVLHQFLDGIINRFQIFRLHPFAQFCFAQKINRPCIDLNHQSLVVRFIEIL